MTPQPPATQLAADVHYDQATAPRPTKVPFNGADLSLPAVGPISCRLTARLWHPRRSCPQI